MQLGQCRRQGVHAIDLDVAVRADHKDSCAAQVACDVKQQVERAAVGVVQVFKHDQERLVECATMQEVRSRLQQ